MPVQFYRGLTGSISVGYSHPPPRNDDGFHRRSIPRKSQTSESESVGGLGKQILLRSGESNPNKPVSNEKEISGTDVLLAIQRATAQRKRSNADKKKKTKIGGGGMELLSTAGESTGDKGVDYSNVRSLMIKNDWGDRLDEFEKLLTEFQDMEL
ncbi:F19 [Hirschfeldia incana]|nr:F19 [Hirschfeldia incana]